MKNTTTTNCVSRSLKTCINVNLFFDANTGFQTYGFVGLLPLVMDDLALKGLCMYIVCSSEKGITFSTI